MRIVKLKNENIVLFNYYVLRRLSVRG